MNNKKIDLDTLCEGQSFLLPETLEIGTRSLIPTGPRFQDLGLEYNDIDKALVFRAYKNFNYRWDVNNYKSKYIGHTGASLRDHSLWTYLFMYPGITVDQVLNSNDQYYITREFLVYRKFTFSLVNPNIIWSYSPPGFHNAIEEAIWLIKTATVFSENLVNTKVSQEFIKGYYDLKKPDHMTENEFYTYFIHQRLNLLDNVVKKTLKELVYDKGLLTYESSLNARRRIMTKDDVKVFQGLDIWENNNDYPGRYPIIPNFDPVPEYTTLNPKYLKYESNTLESSLDVNNPYKGKKVQGLGIQAKDYPRDLSEYQTIQNIKDLQVNKSQKIQPFYSLDQVMYDDQNLEHYHNNLDSMNTQVNDQVNTTQVIVPKFVPFYPENEFNVVQNIQSNTSNAPVIQVYDQEIFDPTLFGQRYEAAPQKEIPDKPRPEPQGLFEDELMDVNQNTKESNNTGRQVLMIEEEIFPPNETNSFDKILSPVSGPWSGPIMDFKSTLPESKSFMTSEFDPITINKPNNTRSDTRSGSRNNQVFQRLKIGLLGKFWVKVLNKVLVLVPKHEYNQDNIQDIKDELYNLLVPSMDVGSIPLDMQDNLGLYLTILNRYYNTHTFNEDLQQINDLEEADQTFMALYDRYMKDKSSVESNEWVLGLKEQRSFFSELSWTGALLSEILYTKYQDRIDPVWSKRLLTWIHTVRNMVFMARNQDTRFPSLIENPNQNPEEYYEANQRLMIGMHDTCIDIQNTDQKFLTLKNFGINQISSIGPEANTMVKQALLRTQVGQEQSLESDNKFDRVLEIYEKVRSAQAKQNNQINMVLNKLDGNDNIDKLIQDKLPMICIIDPDTSKNIDLISQKTVHYSNHALTDSQNLRIKTQPGPNKHGDIWSISSDTTYMDLVKPETKVFNDFRKAMLPEVKNISLRRTRMVWDQASNTIHNELLNLLDTETKMLLGQKLENPMFKTLHDTILNADLKSDPFNPEKDIPNSGSNSDTPDSGLLTLNIPTNLQDLVNGSPGLQLPKSNKEIQDLVQDKENQEIVGSDLFSPILGLGQVESRNEPQATEPQIQIETQTPDIPQSNELNTVQDNTSQEPNQNDQTPDLAQQTPVLPVLTSMDENDKSGGIPTRSLKKYYMQELDLPGYKIHPIKPLNTSYLFIPGTFECANQLGVIYTVMNDIRQSTGNITGRDSKEYIKILDLITESIFVDINNIMFENINYIKRILAIDSVQELMEQSKKVYSQIQRLEGHWYNLLYFIGQIDEKNKIHNGFYHNTRDSVEIIQLPFPSRMINSKSLGILKDAFNNGLKALQPGSIYKRKFRSLSVIEEDPTDFQDFLNDPGKSKNEYQDILKEFETVTKGLIKDQISPGQEIVIEEKITNPFQVVESKDLIKPEVNESMNIDTESDSEKKSEKESENINQDNKKGLVQGIVELFEPNKLWDKILKDFKSDLVQDQVMVDNKTLSPVTQPDSETQSLLNTPTLLDTPNSFVNEPTLKPNDVLKNIQGHEGQEIILTRNSETKPIVQEIDIFQPVMVFDAQDNKNQDNKTQDPEVNAITPPVQVVEENTLSGIMKNKGQVPNVNTGWDNDKSLNNLTAIAQDPQIRHEGQGGQSKTQNLKLLPLYSHDQSDDYRERVKVISAVIDGLIQTDILTMIETSMANTKFNLKNDLKSKLEICIKLQNPEIQSLITGIELVNSLGFSAMMSAFGLDQDVKDDLEIVLRRKKTRENKDLTLEKILKYMIIAMFLLSNDHSKEMEYLHQTMSYLDTLVESLELNTDIFTVQIREFTFNMYVIMYMYGHNLYFENTNLNFDATFSAFWSETVELLKLYEEMMFNFKQDKNLKSIKFKEPLVDQVQEALDIDRTNLDYTPADNVTGDKDITGPQDLDDELSMGTKNIATRFTPGTMVLEKIMKSVRPKVDYPDYINSSVSIGKLPLGNAPGTKSKIDLRNPDIKGYDKDDFEGLGLWFLFGFSQKLDQAPNNYKDLMLQAQIGHIELSLAHAIFLNLMLRPNYEQAYSNGITLQRIMDWYMHDTNTLNVLFGTHYIDNMAHLNILDILHPWAGILTDMMLNMDQDNLDPEPKNLEIIKLFRQFYKVHSMAVLGNQKFEFEHQILNVRKRSEKMDLYAGSFSIGWETLTQKEKENCRAFSKDDNKDIRALVLKDENDTTMLPMWYESQFDDDINEAAHALKYIYPNNIDEIIIRKTKY